MYYRKYVGKEARLYNKYACVEGTINHRGNIYISHVRYTEIRYSHMRKNGNWELTWYSNGINPNFASFREDNFNLLIDGKLIFSSCEDIFEAIK